MNLSLDVNKLILSSSNLLFDLLLRVLLFLDFTDEVLESVISFSLLSSKLIIMLLFFLFQAFKPLSELFDFSSKLVLYLLFIALLAQFIFHLLFTFFFALFMITIEILIIMLVSYLDLFSEAADTG